MIEALRPGRRLLAVAAAVLTSSLALAASAAPSTHAIRILPPTSLDWTQYGPASRRPPSYLLVQGSFTSRASASQACAALNEQLVDVSDALKDANLVRQLAFLVMEGLFPTGGGTSKRSTASGQLCCAKAESKSSDRVDQIFWSSDADRLLKLTSNSDGTSATVQAVSSSAASNSWSSSSGLPALCTNSAPWNTVNSTDTSSQWQMSVQSGSGDYATTYTGFRDLLGFRFSAVPYAMQPARFEPSTPLISDEAVHAQLGDSFSALRTTRGLQCPQTSGTDKPYTEDCLVLNIATGFLPGPGTRPAGLRPIIFFLHGGGLTSGSGLDGTFDGTALSSRNDIVVISPNYRLGTLGWLATSASTSPALTGNFGLGDVISALEWVRAHAPTFGGDPDRISVQGQSAGAQLVQLLLQSEAAAGLFQSAVVMSGRPWDKADARVTRQVAERPSSEGGANGLAVLQSLGCAPEQVRKRRRAPASDPVLACLRALPTAKFLSSSVFSAPVVDGKLITEPTLDLSAPSSATAHVNRVPVLLGTMRDELGSLGSVPVPGSPLDHALSDAGIKDPQKSAVVSNKNGAFPRSQQGRDAVQNLTVTVESEITSITRCGHESVLKIASDNGVFPVLHGYEFHSRAWQIVNFDPNAACAPNSDDELRDGYYFLCHSGDVMSVFGTPGFQFALEPRDGLDLDWIRSISDAWAAFARSGGRSPVMSPLYAAVRGYGASRASVAGWTPLGRSNGSQELALLGAHGVEGTRQLGSGRFAEQCATLGLPIDYIREERR